MRNAGLDGAADFMEGLLDYICEVEMDHDVAKAIIDGSWPTADEWITRKRHERNGSELEVTPEERVNSYHLNIEIALRSVISMLAQRRPESGTFMREVMEQGVKALKLNVANRPFLDGVNRRLEALPVPAKQGINYNYDQNNVQ